MSDFFQLEFEDEDAFDLPPTYADATATSRPHNPISAPKGPVVGSTSILSSSPLPTPLNKLAEAYDDVTTKKTVSPKKRKRATVVDGPPIPGHIRIIPGPAGEMARQMLKRVTSIEAEILLENSPVNATRDMVYPRGTIPGFHGGEDSVSIVTPMWKRVMDALSITAPLTSRNEIENHPVASRILRYHVAHLQDPSLKQLRKVPYAIFTIDSINLSSVDAVIILRDPTGTIAATFHRRVLEKFGTDLAVGSLVVLKSCSLIRAAAVGLASRSNGIKAPLIFDEGCHSVYLIVCISNVVTIIPDTVMDSVIHSVNLNSTRHDPVAPSAGASSNHSSSLLESIQALRTLSEETSLEVSVS
jgi:hypothetical protein